MKDQVQTLTKVSHNMSQLGGTDEPITVLIKDLESFLYLLFTISVAHLSCHHRKEFGKIDRSVSISVNFVDHVVKFSLSWILPERAHHRPKFRYCYRAITVFKKLNSMRPVVI
jgi:hypothetical protein